MLTAVKAMIVRDLHCYAKHKSDCLKPVLFFVLISSLFPLVLRLDPERLSMLAPGILWIAIVLSVVPSLENILRGDFEDGSLEQLLLSPQPLSVLLIGKLLAHWIVIGLPLLLIAPILGIALNLPASGFKALLGMMILGIPTLSLITAIAVSLTLNLRHSGMFLALLSLPLLLPVLVLGTSGTHSASLGMNFLAEFYLMAALFIFTLILAPMTMAYAVRLAVQ